MADVEQVLQDEMTICGPSFALEVDAPSPPPWTGVDGTETASSEYSLDLKTNLLLDGAGWKWWRELLVGLGGMNVRNKKKTPRSKRLLPMYHLARPASLFQPHILSLTRPHSR